MPVELQKHFSVEDCNNNPDKIYVFGDNLIHKGKGGQAIIRDCPNAIGIPTKRLPSMAENAFFNDKREEYAIVTFHITKLFTLKYKNNKQIFVFPKDGLGTGRAEMNIQSPKLFKYMNKLLNAYFGLNY